MASVEDSAKTDQWSMLKTISRTDQWPVLSVTYRNVFTWLYDVCTPFVITALLQAMMALTVCFITISRLLYFKIVLNTNKLTIT